MIMLRNTLTGLLGIGSLLLLADSCAASPLPAGRPLRDRAAGYELTVLVDGVPGADLLPRRRELRARPARLALHAARVEPHRTAHGGGGVGRRARRDRRQAGRLPQQARLPGSAVGLRRHRRLADLARAGGGVPLLVGARLVRGAHRQRARGRRDWRRRVPRAPRAAARVPPAAVRRVAAALLVGRLLLGAKRSNDRGSDEAESSAPPAGRSAPQDASPPPRAERRREVERQGRTAKRSRAARAAAAPGWAPNTARRSTRASTRSTSCARTRAIPAAVLGVRYNDRDGLLAMGIPVDSYYDQACYGYDVRRLRRRRPAPHGRAVPGRRPALRPAPSRMAPPLRMALSRARIRGGCPKTRRTRCSCWPTAQEMCGPSSASSRVTKSRCGISSAASWAIRRPRRICCRRCSCAS